MPTIALCMIVKNEAALIERCLDSVQPLIDYALIHDTGSSDGTQAIIRRWLRNHEMTGKVIDEPWKDFGHNRSLALSELRRNNNIDYALIMDADDTIVFEPDFDHKAFKASLTDNAYYVQIDLGTIRYHRTQIVSNHHAWYYRGMIHEFLDLNAPYSVGNTSGFYIQAGTDGSRSQDPAKYRKDAAVLEGALATEKDTFLRQRYTFYLGQSWRDCGEDRRALEAYNMRSTLGGWEEEVFQSLYQAGHIYQRINPYPDMALGCYLRAWDVAPWRAESLHAAAVHCRRTNQHQIGYLIAQRGLEIKEPQSGLFVEPWIYQYGLLDEFSMHAYWIGQYVESLEACELLVREGLISDVDRVMKNAQFAKDKLTT